MNRIVTSREEILSHALELAHAHGMESLNMRVLADSCGVAVGSIYNYFPSKGELLCAVVGEIWRRILGDVFDASTPIGDFAGTLERFYARALDGANMYPDFFATHSQLFSANARAQGRQAMDDMFEQLRIRLRAELANDSRVRPDVYTQTLTCDSIADFALESLVAMLRSSGSGAALLPDVMRSLLYRQG